jgi:hypothetical protein
MTKIGDELNKEQIMNLKHRIMNVEEEVKKRFGGKDVLIPAESEAEFQQKKAEYLKTHHEPVRLVFIHIIYDEYAAKKKNFTF